MLAEEEAGYMQEIADSGETKLERQVRRGSQKRSKSSTPVRMASLTLYLFRS